MNSYFIDLSNYSTSECYLILIALFCHAYSLEYLTPTIAQIERGKLYSGCFLCPKYGVFLVDKGEQPDGSYTVITAGDFCQLTMNDVTQG